MTTSFWNDKTVCVVGGAGLVGTELTTLLLQEHARVTVLDDFSRGKTWMIGAQYITGDAGDRSKCEETFKGADVVFNLAARVGGVLYNQTHSAEMFHENIRLQTVPVIAAREVGVKYFLQCSSVCVYEESRQNPCIETWLGGEPNPANAGYAWAKRMGERVARWSGLEHCVVARPANMYGIYDYFDDRSHVIPALIKKCLNDDVIRVRGTGQEVREFLYATDAARGMLVALEQGEPGAIYNIGSDGANSCTISELAYTIREILGVDKPIEFIGGSGGDLRRIVNGDKLMRLGWQPEVSLQQGLRTVCEWYKKSCCQLP